MNDIRQVAKTYTDADWQVVPLVKGSKKANTSWNKTIYTPADFQATEGIAGKCGAPSGHRVDLDCDAPEAIDAAKLLVPQTGLIHGGPGKPSSHYWFICEGIKTKPFADISDANKHTQMLVEIRSTGGYTMLPPSEHPCGELVSWESERDPMIIQADELYEVACNVALTAFIVRHWGDLDHTSMGHLAGFWLQGGVDPARVLRLFKTIGRLAPGKHEQEILSFAQTTINKFAAGEPITGAPKLNEFLGELAVNRMRSWLKLTNTDTSARTVRFTMADTITPKPVQWLWDKWMPIGSVGLLAGREGLGKSLEALWAAAEMTRGTLPGQHLGQPRTVLIAATEDSWEHVVIPRLMAANADLTHVGRVDVATVEGCDELQLPVDLAALQAMIIERGDVAMLVLDPLISRLAGKLDTHKDAEVRRALEPLVKLADATGIVVLGLIHVNKSNGTDPLNSVMGSRAFTAVARFVHFVIEDPNDDSTRLFGMPKNNLGQRNHETKTFQVNTATVTTQDGDTLDTGRLDWTGVDARSIREILQEANDMKPNKTGDAARWLKDYLTQRQGAAPYDAIKTDGQGDGHSLSTLKRAAKTLQVSHQSMGFPRITWWVLPGAIVTLGRVATQP